MTGFTPFFLSAVAVCGFCSAALAGQKIEYSTPVSLVTAPNPAQEQRDEAMFPRKAKLDFANNPAPDFAPTPSVIVATPYRKPDKDGLFGQKNDPTSQKDDDAAKKSLHDRAGDSFLDAQRAKDSGRLTGAELGRLPDVAISTKESTDKSRLSSDANWNKKTERESGSEWSHDFKPKSYLDSTRPANDTRSFYDRATTLSPTGLPKPSSDPLRGLAWPTETPGKNFATKDELARPEQHLDQNSSKPDSIFGHPAYSAPAYHANIPATRDTHAPSAGSGYFQQGSYTPPPPKKHQIAPATLEFPKRPGDPFR